MALRPAFSPASCCSLTNLASSSASLALVLAVLAPTPVRLTRALVAIMVSLLVRGQFCSRATYRGIVMYCGWGLAAGVGCRQQGIVVYSLGGSGRSGGGRRQQGITMDFLGRLMVVSLDRGELVVMGHVRPRPGLASRVATRPAPGRPRPALRRPARSGRATGPAPARRGRPGTAPRSSSRRGWPGTAPKPWPAWWASGRCPRPAGGPPDTGGGGCCGRA